MDADARAAPEGLRWRPLVAAVLAATLGAWLAPGPWSAGDGRLTLDWQGERVAEAPVVVGAGAPVALAGDVPGGRLVVRLTRGVPTTGTVEATLRLEKAEGAARPALGDATLVATLPDGREARIPALAWDAEAGALRLARRAPRGAAIVLGLLGLVVVLWITEAIPLFVTSLLVPVVLVVAGVSDAKPALAPFFHPIIALFFGGFLMAEAMRRAGLDRRAALTIVARAGRSPGLLFATMLAVSAFLSMWMSNTAATALLVPIALAVTEPLEDRRYRKVVVLGIAYAATLGGTGSAIGTPANPLAIEFLGTFAGREISFVGWFVIGLPLVVLFLPLLGWILWRREGVAIDPASFGATRQRAAAAARELGRLRRPEVLVLLVFVGVVGLWLTQTFHGLDTGIVALAGAVALAVLGQVRGEDLGRISWASLLTFGGGLTLGFFLVESGVSDWIATRFVIVAGLPSWISVTAVALLALGLTAVASNTATAAMLVPLAIPLAGVLGVSPVLLVLVVAIASSIDFALVIGTPPTMIAYSTGLYSAREIFRRGILLDLLGIVVLVTAVLAIWRLLGVV